MRSPLAPLLCLLAAAGLAQPGSARPGAFELLAEVRRAYASLERYHDTGSIERRSRVGEAVVEASLAFETSAGPDRAFQWRLELEAEGGTRRRVFWHEGGESLVYDSSIEQYKAVGSLAAELGRDFGPAGLDALAVPALLAGSPDALGDPEAASVEGAASCTGEEGGPDDCWLLALGRMAGQIESRLWIDRESFLIHRLEVLHAPPPAVPGALPRATELKVQHRISAPGEPLAAGRLAYLPPSAARRVEDWELAGRGDPDELLPAIAFQDEITVELLTVLARIVDSRGEPLQDLAPEEIEARVGKVELPVVGVDWIASGESLEAQAIAAGASPLELERLRAAEGPRGKLVVLFLQADFHAIRIHGHLRMLPFTRELIAGLHPDDRIAVVTFDSHLKLWQDFTRDHRKVQDILDQAMRFGGKPLARREGRLSLHEHFDLAAAKRVATPERALELTAEALAELPGEKEMIYLGWGLGRYGAGGVRMTADYFPAVRALSRSRTTVFVLDVTDADFHSLEVGLKNVARDTGGTYEKTHVFTEQVTKRLARTLRGHFLLTLDRSRLGDRHGRLRIELRGGRKGRVLYKPTSL